MDDGTTSDPAWEPGDRDDGPGQASAREARRSAPRGLDQLPQPSQRLVFDHHPGRDERLVGSSRRASPRVLPGRDLDDAVFPALSAMLLVDA